MKRVVVISLLTLLVAVPLTGCGKSPPLSDDSAAPASLGQVRITQAEYAGRWPLTVNEATLVNKDDMIYLEINGVNYATNGFARGQAKKDGTPDIMNSPYLNPDKSADLADLIQRGLTLKSQ